MITNQEGWNKWVTSNTDPYGKACVDVARRVMEILDDLAPDQDFDAHELITTASKSLDTGGITGFMAGAVAQMVSQCHSRGDDFKRLWNTSYGLDEKAEGVVNPAIITMKS